MLRFVFTTAALAAFIWLALIATMEHSYRPPTVDKTIACVKFCGGQERVERIASDMCSCLVGPIE